MWVFIVIVVLLIIVLGVTGSGKQDGLTTISHTVDFPNPESAPPKDVIDAIDQTLYADQIESNLILKGIQYEKYKRAFKDKIEGNFDKYKYYQEFSVPLSVIDEINLEKITKRNSFQNTEYFDIAGAFVKHRKSHLLNYCNDGDLVELIPEPKNRFDSNAIKVRCNGKLIGYVPKTETEWVGEIIMRDYYAELFDINYDGYTLTVSVAIEY